MTPQQKRQFWINWFVGGIGIAVGAFGIGLMVGAAWMFFLPVDVKLTSATGSVLVAISILMLGKFGTYMTALIQRRSEQVDDANERS